MNWSCESEQSLRAGGHMFLISLGLFKATWGANKAAWCELESWGAGMGKRFLTLVGWEKNVSLRFWGESCELWVAKEGENHTEMSLCLHRCPVFRDPLLHYPGVASSSDIQVPALWSRDFCFRKHFASVSHQEFLPLLALLLGFNTNKFLNYVFRRLVTW